MNNEIIFRIIFIGLYVFIFIFRMVYAIIAKRSGRKIIPDKEAYKNEGKFIITLRYFAPPVWLTVITLYAIYPDWLRFLSIPFPLCLRWIGVGLGVIASLFFLRVQHILGRYWSGQLNLRQDHILIKNGPYKYIRHPMYTITPYMFIFFHDLLA